MKANTAAALLAGVLSLASSASASQMLSLSGHSWETDGFPPSRPGDRLSAVGVVDEIKAPLVWNATTNVYTWHLDDAMSLGETVLGSTHFVQYVGGSITFYVDGLPASQDYGTFPPNETAPASFAHGATYLRGDFTALNLTFDELTQSGSLAGKVTFSSGEMFTSLDNTHGLSFAAAFRGISPDGYDLAVIGSFYLEAISVEETSWARIKAHYR